MFYSRKTVQLKKKTVILNLQTRAGRCFFPRDSVTLLSLDYGYRKTFLFELKHGD